MPRKKCAGKCHKALRPSCPAQCCKRCKGGHAEGGHGFCGWVPNQKQEACKTQRVGGI